MSNDPFDSDEDGGEPMDVLARFFDAHGWANEPVSEDELVTTVQGSWSNYELRAVWRPEDLVLQLLMFPDIRVTEERRAATYETLSLINEQMWMGHFEHWSSAGMLVWRHATLMPGPGALTFEMADALVNAALDECERFYPVFQFVLWGGKSPADAIAAALIETRGEA